jgi:hypothetical protein
MKISSTWPATTGYYASVGGFEELRRWDHISEKLRQDTMHDAVGPALCSTEKAKNAIQNEVGADVRPVVMPVLQAKDTQDN